MRILFSLLLICTLAFTLTSCEQEVDPVTYGVEGLWIGTYKYDPGVSPNQNPQYFSFVVKPGGELLAESKEGTNRYFAVGTWTLNGTTLQANYTYPTSPGGGVLAQTATANFDNSGKLTSGVWFNTATPTTRGTFTMDRVN
jgi:hypothetical protein